MLRFEPVNQKAVSSTSLLPDRQERGDISAYPICGKGPRRLKRSGRLRWLAGAALALASWFVSGGTFSTWKTSPGKSSAYDVGSFTDLWSEGSESGEEGGFEGAYSTNAGHDSGAGGAGSQGAPVMVGGENAPVVCKTDDVFDILFIGNSYTHYFEMPRMFAQLAESAGCNVHVDYVAPGGKQLAFHAESGETLSMIGSRDWDAVVLQNYSILPSLPLPDLKERTLPAVSQLVETIRENRPETEIHYYVTWGRRDGDSRYCAEYPDVCTFRGHTAALHRGYSFYAHQLGGQLVDVGGAWATIARDRRSPFSYRELYARDGSHPSLKGSYLAASVFFAAMFKASPEGLVYPSGLTATSARYIQMVAGSRPLSGV